MSDNKKTAVFGIFTTVASADNATDSLVKSGFSASDISALLPENLGTKQIGTEKATKAPEGAQPKPPGKSHPGSGFSVVELQNEFPGEFATLAAVTGSRQHCPHFLETSVLHFRKNQTCRTVSVRFPCPLWRQHS